MTSTSKPAKTMDISHVNARYLVGCDGAHSQVRHSLQLPFEGKKYADEFVLCDCELVKQEVNSKYLKKDEAFFYNDERLVVFFPYNDGKVPLFSSPIPFNCLLDVFIFPNQALIALS